MKKTLALLAMLALSAGTGSHAAGNAENGKTLSATCVACHGPDGNATAPNFPKLAGQVPGYIEKQLVSFKSGARANAIMAGLSQPLSDQAMADLDAYYSSLPVSLGQLDDETRALAEAGEKLFRGGDSGFGIAACMSCHGPNGHGIPTRFPRVAGQHIDYLQAQLTTFKSGERKNEVMNPIAFKLSEQQIRQLSAYMHGLK